MAKKLECIKNLKSKLAQMQKQLQKMESVSHHSKEKYQTIQNSWMNKTVNLSSHQPTSPCLTKSPSWKNPTFWGSNPILGKQNTSQSPSSKWMKIRSPKNVAESTSPKIQQVKKFVESNYYEKSKKQQIRPPARDKKQKTLSQRYFYNFHGEHRETPRFQKIKTYEQAPSDPILNPEKPPQKGKKMVIEIPLSPTSNLIENPKSNPSVYFFNGRMTTLSPKVGNRKNMSPHMRELLSTSLQEKVDSPKRQSFKKHFTRYFRQTFESKWN